MQGTCGRKRLYPDIGVGTSSAGVT